MVLIAVDKLNRKVLGYLCRNGNIFKYCCVECDVEFEASNQLEIHMSKHELRPQEIEDEHGEEEEKEVEQQQQIQQQPNENVPNKNEDMEADTTNGTNSEIDVPLTQDEIENRLRSEYDLKQCSIPLFRFNCDMDELKSESDDNSVGSPSASDEDVKSTGSTKTLRKRTKAPSPRNKAGPRKKLFECEHCSMTFAHAGNFRRHFNSAHPIARPFVCYLCGSKFVTNDKLTVHQQHHQPDSTEAPVFPCPTCGKNVENLKRHLRDHELEMAYELAMSMDNNGEMESMDDTALSIDFTNDGFKQENRDSFDPSTVQTIGLKVEYIVTSDSEFNVLTNGSSSIQNGVHPIDTDPGVKPSQASAKSKIRKKPNGTGFHCTQCPKKFRLEFLLNQHLRNHERPRDPCPVCGKMITLSYKRAHLLRFHRPYVNILNEKAEEQDDGPYIVEGIQS